MTSNLTARLARLGAATVALALCWQLPIYAKSGDLLEVSARALTLRAGPDRKSDVRAWLKRGDSLTELERRGIWIKVDTGLAPPKSIGWVHSRYVEATGEAAPAKPEAGAAANPAQAAASVDAATQDANAGPAAGQSESGVGRVEGGAPEDETESAAPSSANAEAPEPASTDATTGNGGATQAPAARTEASDGGEAQDAGDAPAAESKPAEPQLVATAAPSEPAAEPAPAGANLRARARSRFESFYREYQQVTARYRSITGKDLFTSAIDKGDGQLVLTATDYWFTGTDKDRENDVATVMKLWKKSQESASVLIVVVDDRGLEQMRMFEKLN